MSDKESLHRKTLEDALQYAGEWKAKAFQAQKAAATLKQTAEALKGRAQSAIEGQKELDLSLRKARQVAREQHQWAKRLEAERDQVRRNLEQSNQQRVTALNQLSAVEQQLNLYQTALAEVRDGQELQDIVMAIRKAGGDDPEIEDRLNAELQQVQDELAQARLELQESQLALQSQAAERQTLQDQISGLEQSLFEVENRNQELQASHELVQSQQKVKSASKELELQRLLEDAEEQLRIKSKELRHVEGQLALVESDSQILIEELYSELETAREELGQLSEEKLEQEQRMQAQIEQLEVSKLDLEIVNGELYQRIAELEA